MAFSRFRFSRFKFSLLHEIRFLLLFRFPRWMMVRKKGRGMEQEQKSQRRVKIIENERKTFPKHNYCVHATWVKENWNDYLYFYYLFYSTYFLNSFKFFKYFFVNVWNRRKLQILHLFHHKRSAYFTRYNIMAGCVGCKIIISFLFRKLVATFPW